MLLVQWMYVIVIHMTDTATTSTVLSVRVSAAERALLEAASEQTRTTLSDFVRRKAIEAAELEVLQRTNVVIPAEHWEQFEAWLNEPAKVLPELQKRLRMKPTWQR